MFILMKIGNLFENIILENGAGGGHLVIVDVQPEYYDGFQYWFDEFINYLNKNYTKFNRITMFYNGPELGMINHHEYINWLHEYGLKNKVIDYINFQDKTYAFFRYCMDEGVDEDNIVNLVKFMYENDINDSRDLTEEFWSAFIDEYGDDDIRDLLEFSDDAINIPDLMYNMREYGDDIILCGGGVDECMKEIEIALKALGKHYNVFDKFTY